MQKSKLKSESEIPVIPQAKKRTNWQTYRNDFNNSLIIWSAAIAGLLLLFRLPIFSLADTLFVQPLVKNIPRANLPVQLVLFCALGYGIVHLCIRLRKGLAISVNSLFIFACAAVIYIAYIRHSEYFDFYTFDLLRLGWLGYWDVFLVTIALFLFTYKSYKNPLEVGLSTFSFIDDSPSLEEYEDAYSRNSYAKEIAHHINKTSTKHSFAIGIIGSWGSGKTDFLLRLMKELTADANNKIIEFNPWRINKADGIVDEFFKSLSNAVRPYNQSVTAKISEYSKRILQSGKEIQYRFFDTLVNEWIGDVDIEKQYTIINTALGSTQKRFVVFIDDTDRLTGKEIIEVLRIIRNTANFGNTFFVVAIDEDYMISALKNTKEFANEEEYLKKVFQLIVTLPSFKKSVFVTQLNKFLLTEDLNTADSNLIVQAISNISTDFTDPGVMFYPGASHENILEELIDSMRDLKRFANSFKLAFNLLNDEVELQDLMVLELLRNRNLKVYNLIKNRKLLDYDIEDSSLFKLHEKNWEEFEKTSAIKAEELGKLKRAIEFLLTDSSSKSVRKFTSAYNFYLYFSYQLFDLISLKEFSTILDDDADAIINKFDQWVVEGKQAELFRIVQDINDFPDVDFLHKIVTVYLNVDVDHNFWVMQVIRLLYRNRIANHSKYFEDDPAKHRKFFKRFMAESKIDAYDRATIASVFVSEFNKGNPKLDIALTKKQWQDLIYNLFRQKLEEGDHLDTNLMSLFYHNVDSVDEKQLVTLYQPALAIMKRNLMMRDELFKDYVESLIRPYLNPYNHGDGLVFEPFLESIFGDWITFKKRLIDLKPKDQKFNRLKKIILNEIFQFFEHGKEPFFIKNKEDLEFVEHWMRRHH